MNKNFKKSLIGYKDKEVKKQISDLNSKYEEDLKIYKDQLSELTKLNEKLKEEVQQVQVQLLKSKEMEQKIQETIYKKFIEDCEKVYLIEEKYKEMVNYKKRILALIEKII
jgi:cell division septum initiation protein DivIVA